MYISKEQAVNECVNKGLDVTLDSSVVMLHYDTDKAEEQIQLFGNTLTELGYRCSYGHKGKTAKDISIKTEPMECN